MGQGDPDGILLHHTGSTGEDGDISWLSHYHANPVSINQLIRRDGTIVQIVKNNQIAWHAGVSVWGGRGDCNGWMIGVEICNAGDGVEKYTDAQYETVAQTVAYNCALYHIPDHNVTSHARVALPAGRKDDPKAWDFPRMWKRVDEIRAAWPYGPGVAEWHETVPRVMSTV
jgi:N-acetyl-anhydromuramyl-L-alanine amidase AmpD